MRLRVLHIVTLSLYTTTLGTINQSRTLLEVVRLTGGPPHCDWEEIERGASQIS